MGNINRPKAIETRNIKSFSESIKEDGTKSKLINLRNSLVQLRNSKDNNVEELTELFIELVNILENGK